MTMHHAAHPGPKGLETHDPSELSTPNSLYRALLGIADQQKGTSFWCERIDFGEE